MEVFHNFQKQWHPTLSFKNLLDTVKRSKKNISNLLSNLQLIDIRKARARDEKRTRQWSEEGMRRQ